MLLGQAPHLLVIDLPGVGADAVLRGAEELAGEIDLRPVGEVAAVIEAHPQ